MRRSAALVGKIFLLRQDASAARLVEVEVTAIRRLDRLEKMTRALLGIESTVIRT